MIRSDALTSSLRARYSGSSLRPRCPRVWFSDSAAHVVEGVVAQPHDTERVRDLAGVRQRFVERRAVGVREIQHRPADLCEPAAGPPLYPPHRRLAVLPGTMSNSWPRPTSTTLVAQALARNRPRRPIRCSSSPSASVTAMRCVSAASSASPQRRTDSFTRCQLQPSSSATSPSGPRASSASRAAQRSHNPAR